MHPPHSHSYSHSNSHSYSHSHSHSHSHPRPLLSLPLLPLLVLLFLLLSLPPARANTPPVTADLNSGEDHRAHAVPGGPYVAYDHSGDGFANVLINGARSHSHYYNPSTNVRGRIVKYVWASSSSSTSICLKVSCSVKLPLGLHKLTLTVTDNTGDVASSTTVARVRDGGRPGARFLYYRGNPLVSGSASAKERPNLSRTPSNIAAWSASTFPPGLLAHPVGFSIVVRAELDIPIRGKYSFRIDCGSVAATCTVILDGTVLFPWASGARSRARFLNAMPHDLKIVYRRPFNSVDRSARLVLLWTTPKRIGLGHLTVPSSVISHRPGALPPVVHFTVPSGPVSVDSTLTIYGSGFVLGARVFLGDDECRGAVPRGQFLMTCEVSGSPGVKRVSVLTVHGASNINVVITVVADLSGVGYSSPVKFSGRVVKDGDSTKDWKLSGPTSVVLGPDNRYYFGVQWGAVVTATIIRDRVYNACASKQLPGRSVLGLAFNPYNGNHLKLYATTSTLFWLAKKKLPFSSGWRNGKVVLFEPSKSRPGCMTKTADVVTGLPVSNYDHGVNKIVFDDWGALYITVGSNTNGGVPSKEFGGLYDSSLSGAVLVASTFTSGASTFNGHIKYKHADDPARAVQTGGDVSLFATGLRNSFGLVVHSSGRLYATDNGGNQAFGARSTSCNTETRAQNEDDKLVLLRRGRWYGSANRQRGGKQCVHKRAGKDTEGYETPLATTEAATTGILEYTANTFGARLRSNLLLTQLATSDSQGRLYRVILDAATGKLRKMYTLGRYTGLAPTLSLRGDLVMGRVYKNQVAVLLAQEPNPGVVAVTNVNPYRGPRRGATTITVAGWNFGTDPTVLSVMVGPNACKRVRALRDTGPKGAGASELKCDVPPGTGKVPVVVSVRGVGSSRSAGWEFWYMKI